MVLYDLVVDFGIFCLVGLFLVLVFDVFDVVDGEIFEECGEEFVEFVVVVY